MRVDLPRGTAYSYSLAPSDTLDVEVVQGGPVEHRSSGATSGVVTGGIAFGATRTFDVAGMLVALDEAAVVELTYNTPGIPETVVAPPANGDDPEEATDE